MPGMKRLSILIIALFTVGLMQGCKLPPVPDDQKVGAKADSSDASKPSVDPDSDPKHNAITEGEDDESKARRNKARESLGMK